MMKTRSILGLSLLIVTAGSFLAFQNCSSPANPVTATQNSLAAGAPFAYDATVDQFAYMSCSGNVANDPTFFTLKAGAYSGAGVRLSSAFTSYLTKLKSGQSATDLLTQSSINNNMMVQFDVRVRNQLQSRTAFTPPSGITVRDYSYFFLNPLSQPPLSLALLSGNSRVSSYTDPGTGQVHPFEASLQLNFTDAAAQYFRNALATDLLTMVFTTNDGSGNRPPASPVGSPGVTVPNYLISTTSQQTIFGRGFALSFAQPQPSDFGQGGNSSPSVGTEVIGSIIESNLNVFPNDGDNGGNWVCPANLRLKIMRAADAGFCPNNADNNPSTDQQRVRRVLPSSQWFVDLSNHCAYAKYESSVSSCYGIAPKVSYDLTQPCSFGNVNGSCAHFVSICYRQ